jgi:WD40 repeat protein
MEKKYFYRMERIYDAEQVDEEMIYDISGSDMESFFVLKAGNVRTLGIAAAIGLMTFVTQPVLSENANPSSIKISQDMSVQKNQCPITVKAHTGAINHLVFSPDKKLLASSDEDHVIKIWDMPDGELLHSLSGHANGITSLFFSSDGKLLVSLDWDGKIVIWDVSKGKLLSVINSDKEKLYAVEFFPEMGILALGTSDNAVRIYKLPSYEKYTICAGHLKPVKYISFSSNGKMMATYGADYKVILWNTSTGEKISEIFFSLSDVNKIRLSPDGKLLIALTIDKKFFILDISTGLKRYYDIQDPLFDFSPDGSILAFRTKENSIALWEAPLDGKIISVLDGDTSKDISLYFSFDGKNIITESADNELKIWDVKTGHLLSSTIWRNSNYYTGRIFTPDGRYLIKSGTSGIFLIDTQSWEITSTLQAHNGGLNAMALNSSGDLLVSGDVDHSIKLWQIPSGRSSGCLFDPKALDKSEKLKIVKTKLSDGSFDYQYLSFDMKIPKGSVCTCNNVQGEYVKPVSVTNDNKICTCNQICTCVPVMR